MVSMVSSMIYAGARWIHLEGVACMPSTPPDNDEMERLTADSGFTLDVLDKKAREVYDCAYSTTYQRYQTAIAMLIDDLLGVL